MANEAEKEAAGRAAAKLVHDGTPTPPRLNRVLHHTGSRRTGSDGSKIVGIPPVGEYAELARKSASP